MRGAHFAVAAAAVLAAASCASADAPALSPRPSGVRMKARGLPPPLPFDMASVTPYAPGQAGATAAPSSSGTPRQLRIDVMTMPAYGHYMTTRDIAVALALRGHNVTFVGCDATRRDFDADGLGSRYGMGWRGAGACPIYAEREGVMAQLIEDGSPAVLLKMLESVAELAHQMCEVLIPQYDALAALDGAPPPSPSSASPRRRHLPHAIVFDADTYCAMDISIRHRIPRVARVGTGLRDAYTNPVYAPSYGGGAGVTASLRGRLTNALTLLFSRLVFAPMVLPNLYGRHRREWIPGEGGPTAAYAPSLALSRALDERRFLPSLLWDGVPTLYNTHWGLEHARPVQPYEHLIGHTNDFAKSAAEEVPAYLARWMDGGDEAVRSRAAAQVAAAARDGGFAIPIPDPAPVVYVGLGTLSIVSRRFIDRLLVVLSGSPYRIVWSVPEAQQDALVNPHVVRHSRLIRCWCEDRPGTGKEEEEEEEEDDADPEACRPNPGLCARSTGPGSILLVPWAPQVPLLLHPATAVFLTHGGMNGMAEGTFARIPLLCIPFFADQPDNCAHAQDHGFAVSLDWRRATRGDLVNALAHLATNATVREAVQAAWVANTAAGGIPRAVALIEAAAVQRYGAHLGAVPQPVFLPWWKAWDVDVAGALLLLALAAFVALYALARACRCCCRRCCRCCCDGGNAGRGKEKAA